MVEEEALSHEQGGEALPGRIVLYDGQCPLCQASVRFILRRDVKGRIRYAAQQSEIGRRLLGACGHPAQPGGTVLLLEKGRCHERSTAALRVLRALRFPWPLLYGLILVPRALRDAVYDFVSRRRHRWFGRRERCLLPSPEHAERFLDAAQQQQQQGEPGKV